MNVIAFKGLWRDDRRGGFVKRQADIRSFNGKG